MDLDLVSAGLFPGVNGLRNWLIGHILMVSVAATNLDSPS